MVPGAVKPCSRRRLGGIAGEGICTERESASDDVELDASVDSTGGSGGAKICVGSGVERWTTFPESGRKSL